MKKQILFFGDEKYSIDKAMVTLHFSKREKGVMSFGLFIAGDFISNLVLSIDDIRIKGFSEIKELENRSIDFEVKDSKDLSFDPGNNYFTANEKKYNIQSGKIKFEKTLKDYFSISLNICCTNRNAGKYFLFGNVNAKLVQKIQ
jgi:hypothetical protein